MNKKYKPQESYEDRQKAKGLTRISPWVPVEKVEKARKYCQKLCKEYEREQRANRDAQSVAS